MQFRRQRKIGGNHLSRRDCLKLGLLGAAGALFPFQALAGPAAPATGERFLSLYNIHTGERLKRAVFWVEGQFIPETLDEISHLLRDHRTGAVHPIEPGLLALLSDLKRELPSCSQFHVISGYRSPQTNKDLRRQGSGVAKSSLHMEGKAIDLRVPECDLSKLRKTALAMKRGGVGYYPNSDFVHLDTGRVRWWNGS